MRIDSTFAGDYELGVFDGSDLAETVAYQYPPGAVVDLASFAVPERTISYWIAGSAPTGPVPMKSPDPVQVEVRRQPPTPKKLPPLLVGWASLTLY